MQPGDLAAVLADARSHRGRQHPYCESCLDGIERLVAEIERLTSELGQAAQEAAVDAVRAVADALAVMGNPRDQIERRDIVRWLRHPRTARGKTPGDIVAEWERSNRKSATRDAERATP